MSVFRRGGIKPEAPSGDPSTDAAELEAKLASMTTAWAAPRGARGLAAAMWRPELGAFEVVVPGRKHLGDIGFRLSPADGSSKLMLHVEEAAYLTDRGMMALFLEQPDQVQDHPHGSAAAAGAGAAAAAAAGAGAAAAAGAGAGSSRSSSSRGKTKQLLSVQEAYGVMVQLGVSMSRYLVYCHLQRLGYTITRYPACWHLTHPQQHPAHIWGSSPAWRAADGWAVLPLPCKEILQGPEEALRGAAAADGAGAAAGGGTGGCGVAGPYPEAAAVKAQSSEAKRRKVEQQGTSQAAAGTPAAGGGAGGGAAGGGQWWFPDWALPEQHLTTPEQEQQLEGQLGRQEQLEQHKQQVVQHKDPQQQQGLQSGQGPDEGGVQGGGPAEGLLLLTPGQLLRQQHPKLKHWPAKGLPGGSSSGSSSSDRGLGSSSRMSSVEGSVEVDPIVFSVYEGKVQGATHKHGPAAGEVRAFGLRVVGSSRRDFPSVRSLLALGGCAEVPPGRWAVVDDGDITFLDIQQANLIDLLG